MAARLDLELGSVSTERVMITFGPHYFVEISKAGEKVQFVLGATDHGIKADASTVGGELEKMIEVLRREFSANRVDLRSDSTRPTSYLSRPHTTKSLCTTMHSIGFITMTCWGTYCLLSSGKM